MKEGYTLITGASKGIGLELTKIFAKNHHNLILVARSKDVLIKLKDNLTKEYNIKIEVIVVDLTIHNVATEIYQKTKELGCRVDYLINNAGFGDYGEFLDSSMIKNHNMVHINIISLIDLCYLYAKDMKAYGFGKIMNVASIASFIPGPLMATYYATKSFVLSFSEALSKELKTAKVTVTALCPGTTKTNFFDVASANDSNLLKNLKPASPQKVAKYGYKKMMQNKVVAIYGFNNRLMIFATRFAPRRLIRYIAYKIQSKRK